MRSLFFLFLLLMLGTFSCIPHKRIIYLQKTAETYKDTIDRAERDYAVQPKDRLFIRVTSYNSEVTEFFNLNSRGAGQGGVSMGASALLMSYYVNESGYVEIPLLDSVKVADLTIPQIQDSLQKAIRHQVSDAFVIVALANYQVTVMGEVGSEGIVSGAQNRMTIFDAIAQSGGVSEFGDRKNIRIVRKIGNEVNIAYVDITARDIISSEYYYLNPNDIIYVQQLKGKTFLNNLTNVSRVMGIIVGFILLERLIPR